LARGGLGPELECYNIAGRARIEGWFKNLKQPIGLRREEKEKKGLHFPIIEVGGVNCLK
jgi:hypothetical protein